MSEKCAVIGGGESRQQQQQQLDVSDVRVLERGMMLEKVKMTSRLKRQTLDAGANKERTSVNNNNDNDIDQTKPQIIFYRRLFRIDMQRRHVHAKTKKLMKKQSICKKKNTNRMCQQNVDIKITVSTSKIRFTSWTPSAAVFA